MPQKGPERNDSQQQLGAAAQRAVGYVGSDAHLRGTLCRRQHLQLPQTRLHLLRQSLLGTSPSLTQPDGDGHYEVCLSLRARPVRLLLRYVRANLTAPAAAPQKLPGTEETFTDALTIHSGLNQLLWYYADLEKQACYEPKSGKSDLDACVVWRRFAK